MDYYNKHYITVDDQNRVTSAWSDGPHPEMDPARGLCINEEGGYQLRLTPDGEENPPLTTISGIPLYKWNGTEVMARTEEEIVADLAALPEPAPTPGEVTESKVDFLMALNGMVSPPIAALSSEKSTEPTIEDYIIKYYPRLWGPLHLAKLVDVGLILEEDYERLVKR